MLEQLRPKRNPLLRANTIKVYAMVVRALVRGGWITAPQGATLNEHAGRL